MTVALHLLISGEHWLFCLPQPGNSSQELDTRFCRIACHATKEHWIQTQILVYVDVGQFSPTHGEMGKLIQFHNDTFYEV